MNAVADQLRRGEVVTFRPSGHSMTPIIRHREQVTVAPVDRKPQEGDVVLVKLRGRWLLHRVKSVADRGYLIANAKGHENGWASLSAIAGIMRR